MKQFIALISLIAVISVLGIQSIYAEDHKKGICTTQNADGTRSEQESTKADCKGEFKAKPKQVKKK